MSKCECSVEEYFMWKNILIASIPPMSSIKKKIYLYKALPILYVSNYLFYLWGYTLAELRTYSWFSVQRLLLMGIGESIWGAGCIDGCMRSKLPILSTTPSNQKSIIFFNQHILCYNVVIHHLSFIIFIIYLLIKNSIQNLKGSNCVPNKFD